VSFAVDASWRDPRTGRRYGGIGR